MKEAGATPESEWRKIKKTYLMLEEWFEDRTLFHMVGFLVSQDLAIEDIQTRSKNCAKSEFEQSLRQIIFERVIAQKPLCPTDEESVRMDVLIAWNHLYTARRAGLLQPPYCFLI